MAHAARWQGPALFMFTALGLAGLWSARARSQGGEGFEMPPEVVTIRVAEARPWRSTSTLPATLAPLASIEVRTEVGGRLVQVGFESGEAVAQGQVLAKLDTAAEEAELRAAQAEQRAIALRYGRLSQVEADGGATKMELDQTSSDAEAAAARVDAVRARIRQKTVLAPFAGRMGLRRHHPGQVVDPGSQLATLVATSSALYADVWAPQTLLPALPLGAKVVLRLDAGRAEATVEVIEPQADPARRAVLVRARLDPAPAGWLPGMAAQVEVPTTAEEPRVVVPASALQWSPAGVLVYRVVAGDSGKVVTANPVEVLADLGGEVVLANGLDAGASIVTDGAFKLHEGSAVSPAGGAHE